MFYNKYTKIKEAYGKNHHKKYVFILTKKNTTPFGIISKPNIKIVERGTFDTPNTQIHDLYLCVRGLKPVK
jgi:hypothetical protein